MTIPGWLFNNPRYFQYFSIILGIWPFIVLFIQPSLLPTVTLILILLLVYRYHHLVERFKEIFSKVSVVIKYRIILFTVSGLFTLWFVNELLEPKITPLLLTFCFILFYYIWSNRQLTQQYDNPYVFVPKDATTSSSSIFNLSYLVLSILLTSIVATIIILINSFIESRATILVLSSELHYYFAVPVVFIHDSKSDFSVSFYY